MVGVRYRILYDWQRLPASLVTAGWLRPSGPAPGAEPRVPHTTLKTLLALYGQLFTSNLEGDPTMEGSAFELDLESLAATTGESPARLREVLRLFESLGLLRVSAGSAELLDPEMRSWPPRAYAMLPVRYAVSKLPLLKGRVVAPGDVLALYLTLVVHRNRETEEIWFSRTKSAESAGLTPPVALRCLSVLMRASLVVRSGLSTFKYLLLGFEADGRAAGVVDPQKSRSLPERPPAGRRVSYLDPPIDLDAVLERNRR